MLRVLSAVMLGVVLAGTALPAPPANPPSWSEPVFRSAYRLIATPDEWSVLDTISPGQREHFLRRFWKHRDPTPATDINEVRDQFFERVDLARVRFRTSLPDPPWDERGGVYIRLGPPDDIIYHEDSIYLPIEDWYYYNRNLTLRFSGHELEYRMVPFVSFTGETQSWSEFFETRREVDSSPVVYETPPGVEDLTLSLDCYPFRRADGNYDVYFASTIPLRSIADYTDWPAAELDYTARVIAFDSALHTRWSDSTVVRKNFKQLPRGRLAQNQWQKVLPPGFYIFTAEINNVTGKKHAVGSLDRWLVPYLDSVRLDLSPLVVAADVRPANPHATAFVRNDREIVPMPGHVFNTDQDVAFYHEVYNLQPDASGLCRYHIEYALYDRDARRTLLASRDLASAEQETFQAGKIPHTKLAKGTHILEVKTTDLNTHITKTALAHFKVE